jgi:hypothetical protein
MNDMLTIVNLNAYIQHTGQIFLDGKAVLCISLDRTCTFQAKGESDIILTDAQLEDLVRQIARPMIPQDNDNSRRNGLVKNLRISPLLRTVNEVQE